MIEHDDQSLESFMLELEREDDQQWDEDESCSLIRELERQVGTTKNGMRMIDSEGQAARIIDDDEGIESKTWSRLMENMYFGDIVGNRPLVGKYIQQVFQPSQASSMTEGSELSPPPFSPTRKRTSSPPPFSNTSKRTRTRKFPNEGVEVNTVRSVSPTTVTHFPVVKIIVIGIL